MDDFAKCSDEDTDEAEELDKTEEEEILKHNNFIDDEYYSESETEHRNCHFSEEQNNYYLIEKLSSADNADSEDESIVGDLNVDHEEIINDLPEDVSKLLLEEASSRRSKAFLEFDEKEFLQQLYDRYKIEERKDVYENLLSKVIFGEVEEKGQCLLKALEVGLMHAYTSQIKKNVKHDELKDVLGKPSIEARNCTIYN